MNNRLLLLVGGLFVLVSPALFFRSCSDYYGCEGVALFGTEITAFTGVMVSYCTNGSECTAGLGPVLLPLGLLMLGSVLIRR